MAKGNDGNFLQHSVEVSLALHLSKHSAQKCLHLALTHGMAPFEPCSARPHGPSRDLLEIALRAAQKPAIEGESPVVKAYRATAAALTRFPNSGELLAAEIGRDRLFGAITEVDAAKYERLVEAWRNSGVTPANASWRSAVHRGGVLSCPKDLRIPWLLSADPMTFCQDGDADDDRIYQADLGRLATAMRGFVRSGLPGAAALFVYAVKPGVRAHFWRFVDSLAAATETTVDACWVEHREEQRNLAALLYSRVVACPLPDGVHPGRS
jgi:hypothetical protein